MLQYSAAQASAFCSNLLSFRSAEERMSGSAA